MTRNQILDLLTQHKAELDDEKKDLDQFFWAKTLFGRTLGQAN